MSELAQHFAWRIANFFVPERSARPLWALVGRAILLVAVAFYAWRFFRLGMRELTDLNGDYALHSVHLVFHEAGHVLFGPFGDFMQFLGGSLLQVLMPLLWFVAARFWGGDAFTGALCLWLMGHSLIDIAPYINDARSLQITLIGGVTGREVEGHDWEYILTHLNLLHRDVHIARQVMFAGRWVMGLSLAWATVALIVEFRRAAHENADAANAEG
jgi:hypothetical protein